MKDWPHAPVHRLGPSGAYMVTAGTYRKAYLFNSPARLDLLVESLFALAAKYNWQLQAWAAFSNHYHFVAQSETSANLPKMLRTLHSQTALALNAEDASPSRQVWFQYWDTHLTYEKSYSARLAYVHHNTVHHGLVRTPSAYPWCSAGWFETRAARSFYTRIMSLPIDKVRVRDDFEVLPFGVRER